MDDAARAYAANHYSQGVASVFCLSQHAISGALKAEASNSSSADEKPVVISDASEDSSQAASDATTSPTQQPPSVSLRSEEPVLRKFAVYLVGNRYNPSNFWTGRWRSYYEIDMDARTVVGEMIVDVHYYEQGNVQMHASSAANFTVSATEAEAAGKEIAKKIATAEREYQLSLNEAYSDMSEKTFKELRRALPVHKQKLDWNRIASHRLTNELKKA